MNFWKPPLYGKILAWFLVNLVMLGLFGYVYVSRLVTPELEWLLSGPSGDRIEQLSVRLADRLMQSPQVEWLDILENFEDRRGVIFALFNPDGRQVLGHAPDPLESVRSKLLDKRRPEMMQRTRPRRAESSGQPPKPRFLLRSENPTRYWAGIHMDILYEQGGLWYPLTMVMVSGDLSAGGLLFDWTPWMVLLCGSMLLSALLWLPVVRGITGAVRRTNEASKLIAAGQFDTRLREGRGDELGELAASVNAMAAQLGGYVREQRRITADVAHELCSPIARMQMALGLVEQRCVPEQAAYIKKLDQELQHMARLVEEVLAFSRAEALPELEPAEEVSLRELVSQVVAREAPETPVRVEVEDLNLHVCRKALDRAVGNVIRNAVRYATDIEVHGRKEAGRVVICVLDRGPGVPEESLMRLFEPFYRPEAARRRSTGGSGLGLAITKRCIEACGGRVTARNREGGGLDVTMDLQLQ